MKKTILFLATIGWAISSQAQLDPLDQYLFKSFFSSLIKYDSITVSVDTGANFMAEATANMDYFFQNNERIDTSVIQSMGTVEQTFKGSLKENRYELAEFDPMFSQTDTAFKYVFYQNVAGQDSVVELYGNSGSGLMLVGMYQLKYNNNAQLELIRILSSLPGSSGLDTVTRVEYHYDSQGLLDSLAQISGILNIPVGKMIYHYQNNRLEQFDVYVDTSGAGTLSREVIYKFKHNNQDEITEMRQLEPNSGGLDLFQVYRYSIKANSTIGIPENDLADIEIYPNPASDWLRLSGDTNGKAYQLISSDGSLLQKGTIRESRIDIQRLNPGHYQLIIVSAKTKGSFSFVKE